MDFLKINRDKVLLAIAGASILFILYSLRNKAARSKVKETFSIKEFLILSTFWLVGLLILNLPLLRQFPPATLITGTQISDDSVAHANWARGFEFTDGSRYALSTLSDFNAPRAFHSFIHYSNLNNKETYEILLPSIIFGYSLVVIAVYGIIKKELKKSNLNYLLLLAPVTPFLVVNSIYIMFLNQVVIIPILIGTIFFIFNLNLKKIKFSDIVIFLTLTFALFNTYSILPISIVALAVGLKLAQYFFEKIITERKNFLSNLNSGIKKFRPKINLIRVFVLIILIVLLIPGVIATKNLLAFESSTGSLSSSVGNLPSGFLDPLHITGMWTSATPYRGYLSGALARFGLLLLIYFAFQIFIIIKSKISTRLLLANIALFLPIVGTLFVLRNPYINFKFLTFFIPVFVLTFFISLFKVAEDLDEKYKLKFAGFKVIAAGIVFVIGAIAVVYPLRGYSKFVPFIQDFQFEEMKLITHNYLPNSKTMILSKENWLQYFSTEKDDYIPMTLYYVSSYYDTPLNKIVVDEAYREQAMEYLKTYQPRTFTLINNFKDSCISKPLVRYTLYDLDCQAK